MKKRMKVQGKWARAIAVHKYSTYTPRKEKHT
jgi:hypothetical protein